MQTTTFLLILSASVAVSLACSDCSVCNFNYGRGLPGYLCSTCGKKYFTSDTPYGVNYTEAKNFCEKRGARLVTIKSKYEQTCIEKLFKSNPVLAGKSAWLGMRRTGISAVNHGGTRFQFDWDFDGSSVWYGYNHFMTLAVHGYRQPDGDGTCAHIWGRDDKMYYWNDYFCRMRKVWNADIVALCQVCA